MSEMKCKDCGKTPYEPCEKLESVCLDCYDLRGLFVTAAFTDKTISKELFESVQDVMNSRRWRGAAAMREALGLDQPQI